MRIIFELQASMDQSYIDQNYNKLRGFVNKLFFNAGLIGIHDKEGYKPYSFSNIFPYGDMKTGDSKKFILASPSELIINTVYDYLYKSNIKDLFIGDYTFTLQNVRIIKSQPLYAPLVLKSATPIILRIPERNYDLYNVPAEGRRKTYIYWRPEIAFDSFIKQLTENITKKYNDFYGTSVSCPYLFEHFIFKKPVYTRLISDDGKSYGIASSIWEFKWSNLDDNQKKILTFGIETGFGERNGWGFGFINIANEKRQY